MVSRSAQWPEGLDDLEAVHRLQSILISACEGARDLSLDREYKRFRIPLIQRADLTDVVPRFVRSNRDLNSYWSYIRGVADKWDLRRRHVWQGFEPLFDRIEGRSRPPVPSGNWTGRRTATQQARVVLSLAPDALEGVNLLLEEQEQILHNGGPVEPEQRQAIDALRQLHAALGELLVLAENDKPLGQALERIQSLKRATFKWSAETFSLTVAGSPLVASSTVLGCGVMMLVNVLAKDMGAAATIGAGAMAAHGIRQKTKS